MLAAGADEPASHPVEGRYSVESDAGGAVWAFRPGGALFVTGPTDQEAEGTWAAGVGDRAFDASLEVSVTGQQLSVLGEVSQDGIQIAMYVTATEPTHPENADPWPLESRITGARFGFVSDATPPPSPQIDCLRPAWRADGTVDWDRCGLLASAASPTGDASPPPS